MLCYISCLPVYLSALLSVSLFLCLSDCVCICLSVYLFNTCLPGKVLVYVSVCEYLSDCQPLIVSIYLSICLSMSMRVCVSVYQTVSHSLCLSIYLSVHVYASVCECSSDCQPLIVSVYLSMPKNEWYWLLSRSTPTLTNAIQSNSILYCLFYHIRSYPTCLMLHCPILIYPILSYSILPYYILLNPILFYPVIFYVPNQIPFYTVYYILY